MKMRSSPGHQDLFGKKGDLEQLLEGIPSSSVIQTLCWLNAQFLNTAAPIERDEELRYEFTKTLSRHEMAQLGYELAKDGRTSEERRIFHSVYITYFLHHELTHFRDLPKRELSDAEYLRVFRAYLVIVDIYNDDIDIPEPDIDLPDDEFFSQRAWPMLSSSNMNLIAMWTQLLR